MSAALPLHRCLAICIVASRNVICVTVLLPASSSAAASAALSSALQHCCLHCWVIICIVISCIFVCAVALLSALVSAATSLSALQHCHLHRCLHCHVVVCVFGSCNIVRDACKVIRNLGTYFTGTYVFLLLLSKSAYCAKVQYFVKYQNTRFRDPTTLLSMDIVVERFLEIGASDLLVST
jgi:hypothetical protein